MIFINFIILSTKKSDSMSRFSDLPKR